MSTRQNKLFQLQQNKNSVKSNQDSLNTKQHELKVQSGKTTEFAIEIEEISSDSDEDILEVESCKNETNETLTNESGDSLKENHISKATNAKKRMIHHERQLDVFERRMNLIATTFESHIRERYKHSMFGPNYSKPKCLNIVPASSAQRYYSKDFWWNKEQDIQKLIEMMIDIKLSSLFISNSNDFSFSSLFYLVRSSYNFPWIEPEFLNAKFWGCSSVEEVIENMRDLYGVIVLKESEEITQRGSMDTQQGNQTEKNGQKRGKPPRKKKLETEIQQLKLWDDKKIEFDFNEEEDKTLDEEQRLKKEQLMNIVKGEIKGGGKNAAVDARLRKQQRFKHKHFANRNGVSRAQRPQDSLENDSLKRDSNTNEFENGEFENSTTSHTEDTTFGSANYFATGPSASILNEKDISTAINNSAEDNENSGTKDSESDSDSDSSSSDFLSSISSSEESHKSNYNSADDEANDPQTHSKKVEQHSTETNTSSNVHHPAASADSLHMPLPSLPSSKDGKTHRLLSANDLHRPKTKATPQTKNKPSAQSDSASKQPNASHSLLPNFLHLPFPAFASQKPFQETYKSLAQKTSFPSTSTLNSTTTSSAAPAPATSSSITSSSSTAPFPSSPQSFSSSIFPTPFSYPPSTSSLSMNSLNSSRSSSSAIGQAFSMLSSESPNAALLSSVHSASSSISQPHTDTKTTHSSQTKTEADNTNMPANQSKFDSFPSSSNSPSNLPSNSSSNSFSEQSSSSSSTATHSSSQQKPSEVNPSLEQLKNTLLMASAPRQHPRRSFLATLANTILLLIKVGNEQKEKETQNCPSNNKNDSLFSSQQSQNPQSSAAKQTSSQNVSSSSSDESANTLTTQTQPNKIAEATTAFPIPSQASSTSPSESLFASASLSPSSTSSPFSSPSPSHSPSSSPSLSISTTPSAFPSASPTPTSPLSPYHSSPSSPSLHSSSSSPSFLIPENPPLFVSSTPSAAPPLSLTHTLFIPQQLPVSTLNVDLLLPPTPRLTPSHASIFTASSSPAPSSAASASSLHSASQTSSQSSSSSSNSSNSTTSNANSTSNSAAANDRKIVDNQNTLQQKISTQKSQVSIVPHSASNTPNQFVSRQSQQNNQDSLSVAWAFKPLSAPAIPTKPSSSYSSLLKPALSLPPPPPPPSIPFPSSSSISIPHSSSSLASPHNPARLASYYSPAPSASPSPVQPFSLSPSPSPLSPPLSPSTSYSPSPSPSPSPSFPLQSTGNTSHSSQKTSSSHATDSSSGSSSSSDSPSPSSSASLHSVEKPSSPLRAVSSAQTSLQSEKPKVVHKWKGMSKKEREKAEKKEKEASLETSTNEEGRERESVDEQLLSEGFVCVIEETARVWDQFQMMLQQEKRCEERGNTKDGLMENANRTETEKKEKEVGRKDEQKGKSEKKEENEKTDETKNDSKRANHEDEPHSSPNIVRSLRSSGKSSFSLSSSPMRSATSGSSSLNSPASHSPSPVLRDRRSNIPSNLLSYPPLKKLQASMGPSSISRFHSAKICRLANPALIFPLTLNESDYSPLKVMVEFLNKRRSLNLSNCNTFRTLPINLKEETLSVKDSLYQQSEHATNSIHSPDTDTHSLSSFTSASLSNSDPAFHWTTSQLRDISIRRHLVIALRVAFGSMVREAMGECVREMRTKREDGGIGWAMKRVLGWEGRRTRKRKPGSDGDKWESKGEGIKGAKRKNSEFEDGKEEELVQAILHEFDICNSAASENIQLNTSSDAESNWGESIHFLTEKNNEEDNSITDNDTSDGNSNKTDTNQTIEDNTTQLEVNDVNESTSPASSASSGEELTKAEINSPPSTSASELDLPLFKSNDPFLEVRMVTEEAQSQMWTTFINFLFDVLNLILLERQMEERETDILLSISERKEKESQQNEKDSQQEDNTSKITKEEGKTNKEEESNVKMEIEDAVSLPISNMTIDQKVDSKNTINEPKKFEPINFNQPFSLSNIPQLRPARTIFSVPLHSIRVGNFVLAIEGQCIIGEDERPFKKEEEDSNISSLSKTDSLLKREEESVKRNFQTKTDANPANSEQKNSFEQQKSSFQYEQNILKKSRLPFIRFTVSVSTETKEQQQDWEKCVTLLAAHKCIIEKKKKEESHSENENLRSNDNTKPEKEIANSLCFDSSFSTTVKSEQLDVLEKTNKEEEKPRISENYFTLIKEEEPDQTISSFQVTLFLRDALSLSSPAFVKFYQPLQTVVLSLFASQFNNTSSDRNSFMKSSTFDIFSNKTGFSTLENEKLTSEFGRNLFNSLQNELGDRDNWLTLLFSPIPAQLNENLMCSFQSHLKATDCSSGMKYASQFSQNIQESWAISQAESSKQNQIDSSLLSHTGISSFLQSSSAYSMLQQSTSATSTYTNNFFDSASEPQKLMKSPFKTTNSHLHILLFWLATVPYPYLPHYYPILLLPNDWMLYLLNDFQKSSQKLSDSSYINQEKCSADIPSPLLLLTAPPSLRFSLCQHLSFDSAVMASENEAALKSPNVLSSFNYYMDHNASVAEQLKSLAPSLIRINESNKKKQQNSANSSELQKANGPSGASSSTSKTSSQNTKTGQERSNKPAAMSLASSVTFPVLPSPSSLIPSSSPFSLKYYELYPQHDSPGTPIPSLSHSSSFSSPSSLYTAARPIPDPIAAQAQSQLQGQTTSNSSSFPNRNSSVSSASKSTTQSNVSNELRTDNSKLPSSIQQTSTKIAPLSLAKSITFLESDKKSKVQTAVSDTSLTNFTQPLNSPLGSSQTYQPISSSSFFKQQNNNEATSMSSQSGLVNAAYAEVESKLSSVQKLDSFSPTTDLSHPISYHIPEVQHHESIPQSNIPKVPQQVNSSPLTFDPPLVPHLSLLPGSSLFPIILRKVQSFIRLLGTDGDSHVTSYPFGPGAADPVLLTVRDVERLRQGRWLNDNIITFYIRYLITNVLREDEDNDEYIMVENKNSQKEANDSQNQNLKVDPQDSSLNLTTALATLSPNLSTTEANPGYTLLKVPFKAPKYKDRIHVFNTFFFKYMDAEYKKWERFNRAERRLNSLRSFSAQQSVADAATATSEREHIQVSDSTKEKEIKTQQGEHPFLSQSSSNLENSWLSKRGGKLLINDTSYKTWRKRKRKLVQSLKSSENKEKTNENQSDERPPSSSESSSSSSSSSYSSGSNIDQFEIPPPRLPFIIPLPTKANRKRFIEMPIASITANTPIVASIEKVDSSDSTEAQSEPFNSAPPIDAAKSDSNEMDTCLNANSNGCVDIKVDETTKAQNKSENSTESTESTTEISKNLTPEAKQTEDSNSELKTLQHISSSFLTLVKQPPPVLIENEYHPFDFTKYRQTSFAKGIKYPFKLPKEYLLECKEDNPERASETESTSIHQSNISKDNIHADDTAATKIESNDASNKTSSISMEIEPFEEKQNDMDITTKQLSDSQSDGQPNIEPSSNASVVSLSSSANTHSTSMNNSYSLSRPLSERSSLFPALFMTPRHFNSLLNIPITAPPPNLFPEDYSSFHSSSNASSSSQLMNTSHSTVAPTPIPPFMYQHSDGHQQFTFSKSEDKCSHVNYSYHPPFFISQNSSFTAAYNRVRNWTKKKDLFQNDFVLIPINEDNHWSLAVVCYPRLVFDGSVWTGGLRKLWENEVKKREIDNEIKRIAEGNRRKHVSSKRGRSDSNKRGGENNESNEVEECTVKNDNVDKDILLHRNIDEQLHELLDETEWEMYDIRGKLMEEEMWNEWKRKETKHENEIRKRIRKIKIDEELSEEMEESEAFYSLDEVDFLNCETSSSETDDSDDASSDTTKKGYKKSGKKKRALRICSDDANNGNVESAEEAKKDVEIKPLKKKPDSQVVTQYKKLMHKADPPQFFFVEVSIDVVRSTIEQMTSDWPSKTNLIDSQSKEKEIEKRPSRTRLSDSTLNRETRSLQNADIQSNAPFSSQMSSSADASSESAESEPEHFSEKEKLPSSLLMPLSELDERLLYLVLLSDKVFISLFKRHLTETNIIDATMKKRYKNFETELYRNLRGQFNTEVEMNSTPEEAEKIKLQRREFAISETKKFHEQLQREEMEKLLKTKGKAKKNEDDEEMDNNFIESVKSEVLVKEEKKDSSVVEERKENLDATLLNKEISETQPTIEIHQINPNESSSSSSSLTFNKSTEGHQNEDKTRNKSPKNNETSKKIGTSISVRKRKKPIRKEKIKQVHISYETRSQDETSKKHEEREKAKEDKEAVQTELLDEEDNKQNDNLNSESSTESMDSDLSNTPFTPSDSSTPTASLSSDSLKQHKSPKQESNTFCGENTTLKQDDACKSASTWNLRSSDPNETSMIIIKNIEESNSNNQDEIPIISVSNIESNIADEDDGTIEKDEGNFVSKVEQDIDSDHSPEANVEKIEFIKIPDSTGNFIQKQIQNSDCIKAEITKEPEDKPVLSIFEDENKNTEKEVTIIESNTSENYASGQEIEDNNLTSTVILSENELKMKDESIKVTDSREEQKQTSIFSLLQDDSNEHSCDAFDLLDAKPTDQSLKGGILTTSQNVRQKNFEKESDSKSCPIEIETEDEDSSEASSNYDKGIKTRSRSGRKRRTKDRNFPSDVNTHSDHVVPPNRSLGGDSDGNYSEEESEMTENTHKRKKSKRGRKPNKAKVQNESHNCRSIPEPHASPKNKSLYTSLSPSKKTTSSNKSEKGIHSPHSICRSPASSPLLSPHSPLSPIVSGSVSSPNSPHSPHSPDAPRALYPQYTPRTPRSSQNTSSPAGSPQTPTYSPRRVSRSPRYLSSNHSISFRHQPDDFSSSIHHKSSIGNEESQLTLRQRAMLENKLTKTKNSESNHKSNPSEPIILIDDEETTPESQAKTVEKAESAQRKSRRAEHQHFGSPQSPNQEFNSSVVNVAEEPYSPREKGNLMKTIEHDNDFCENFGDDSKDEINNISHEIRESTEGGGKSGYESDAELSNGDDEKDQIQNYASNDNITSHGEIEEFNSANTSSDEISLNAQNNEDSSLGEFLTFSEQNDFAFSNEKQFEENEEKQENESFSNKRNLSIRKHLNIPKFDTSINLKQIGDSAIKNSLTKYSDSSTVDSVQQDQQNNPICSEENNSENALDFSQDSIRNNEESNKSSNSSEDTNNLEKKNNDGEKINEKESTDNSKAESQLYAAGLDKRKISPNKTNLLQNDGSLAGSTHSDVSSSAQKKILPTRPSPHQKANQSSELDSFHVTQAPLSKTFSFSNSKHINQSSSQPSSESSEKKMESSSSHSQIKPKEVKDLQSLSASTTGVEQRATSQLMQNVNEQKSVLKPKGVEKTIARKRKPDRTESVDSAQKEEKSNQHFPVTRLSSSLQTRSEARTKFEESNHKHLHDENDIAKSTKDSDGEHESNQNKEVEHPYHTRIRTRKAVADFPEFRTSSLSQTLSTPSTSTFLATQEDANSTSSYESLDTSKDEQEEKHAYEIRRSNPRLKRIKKSQFKVKHIDMQTINFDPVGNKLKEAIRFHQSSSEKDNTSKEDNRMESEEENNEIVNNVSLMEENKNYQNSFPEIFQQSYPDFEYVECQEEPDSSTDLDTISPHYLFPQSKFKKLFFGEKAENTLKVESSQFPKSNTENNENPLSHSLFEHIDANKSNLAQETFSKEDKKAFLDKSCTSINHLNKADSSSMNQSLSSVSPPKSFFQMSPSPMILFFDSLDTSENPFLYSRAAAIIRGYLTHEGYYRVKRCFDSSYTVFSTAAMPASLPLVPLQRNNCDCGIFMLKDVEMFVKGWVKQQEIERERKELIQKAKLENMTNLLTKCCNYNATSEILNVESKMDEMDRSPSSPLMPPVTIAKAKLLNVSSSDLPIRPSICLDSSVGSETIDSSDLRSLFAHGIVFYTNGKIKLVKDRLTVLNEAVREKERKNEVERELHRNTELAKQSEKRKRTKKKNEGGKEDSEWKEAKKKKADEENEVLPSTYVASSSAFGEYERVERGLIEMGSSPEEWFGLREAFLLRFDLEDLIMLFAILEYVDGKKKNMFCDKKGRLMRWMWLEMDSVCMQCGCIDDGMSAGGLKNRRGVFCKFG